MSRILRRPMFRGGRVDSRGTGITSGLMDDSGYADGGRVGFQVGGSYPSFRSPISTSRTFGVEPGYNLLDKFKSFIPDTRSIRQRSEDEIDKIRSGIDTSGSSVEGAIEFGNTGFESTGFGKNTTTLSSPTTIENVPTQLTEEEELTKQAEIYQKLLGGEEARSQSIYDALLAASPAFFKGKNLREAAPQVLESINKSGAFDKPRDIKQAASQLAIQRRILMDKAKAEAAAKMAELGIKKPSTLTERYSANIKAGINEIKAAELAVIDSYGDRYKPFSIDDQSIRFTKKGEVYKRLKDPKKPAAGYNFVEVVDPETGRFNILPL